MFVYYLTGEYNATIPGSLVILMGISLGTLTTAAALDSAASSTKRQKAQAVQSRVSPEYYDLVNQRNEMKKQLHGIQQKWKDVESEEGQTLMAKQQSLQQALAGLNANLLKDQRNYRLFTRALTLKRSASVAPRSGFWSDLFSNEGGAGLHRVQFGLWTLVMMIVFVYEVFENVAMPDFDKTLLALMGISSGTYAGLKIPEDKGTDTASTDDSADDSADEEIDADVGDFQG